MKYKVSLSISGPTHQFEVEAENPDAAVDVVCDACEIGRSFYDIRDFLVKEGFTKDDVVIEVENVSTGGQKEVSIG